MLHTWAWLSWLLSALLALSATRNPFYLLLILFCLIVVEAPLFKYTKSSPWKFSPLRLATFIIPFTTFFNAATSHFGKTALFHLPRQIPYLGGAITLEALVYGLINGLILVGMLTAFIIVHQAITVRSLIRWIPRAFYSLAIVISIAVTFLPVMMREFHQIREAQAIRGHRLKGLKDWLPLFVPLITGGIEKALQLAEAMAARGFASKSVGENTPIVRFGLPGGIMILTTGWLLDMSGIPNLISLSLVITGSLITILALRRIGQLTPRTTFRNEHWKPNDFLLILSSIMIIILYVFTPPGFDKSSLAYQPYPSLTLPAFDPPIGLTTLALLLPAVLIRFNNHDRL